MRIRPLALPRRRRPTKRPHRIGHEFVGVVEEVGAEVSRIRVGDFVIAPFYDCDMTCPNCLNGVSTSCLHGGWWGADDRMGGFADGGQGERVRVPHADGSLVAVPGGEPAPELVPHLLTLSDVMGTGHHAAHAAGVTAGSTVAVVGDGAVGLCAVLAAKRLGASRIVAMSRHESRQRLAVEFGATDVVAERGDEGIARIKELFDGIGPDAVLECVGTKESMDQAIRSVRPGGVVGYVGVPNGGAELPIRTMFNSNVGVRGGVAPGAQLRGGAAARGARRPHPAGPRVRPRAAAGRGGGGVRRDGRAPRDQGPAAPLTLSALRARVRRPSSSTGSPRLARNGGSRRGRGGAG